MGGCGDYELFGDDIAFEHGSTVYSKLFVVVEWPRHHDSARGTGEPRGGGVSVSLCAESGRGANRSTPV